MTISGLLAIGLATISLATIGWLAICWLGTVGLGSIAVLVGLRVATGGSRGDNDLLGSLLVHHAHVLAVLHGLLHTSASCSADHAHKQREDCHTEDPPAEDDPSVRAAGLVRVVVSCGAVHIEVSIVIRVVLAAHNLFI